MRSSNVLGRYIETWSLQSDVCFRALWFVSIERGETMNRAAAKKRKRKQPLESSTCVDSSYSHLGLGMISKY